MKQALLLSTKQQLKMTPQLQQAIELLQLSALELELKIKEAIEDNPLLETTDQADSNNDTETEIDTDWESAEIAPGSDEPNHQSTEEDYTAYTSQPLSLHEHLYWQLNLTPFSEHDLIIATAIIESINDDGYLLTSLDEIQSTLQTSYPEILSDLELDEIIAVLHRIQQFDPLGVACRSLQECLMIQLNALPNNTYMLDYAKKLVLDYLELLGQRQFSKIKSLLRITEQQLEVTLKLVKQLNPHPGAQISQRQAEYIVPDVIVTKENDRWQISLKQNYSDQLKINNNYAALLNRAASDRDAQFLRSKLNEAKWLINGIETRNKTLLKVASCIITQQQDFLEHGEEKMRPMILQDVAIATGLNESTVSRITTKKYIHTPRGVFELKYFFSSHITNRAGNDCSSIAIKAIIKQLINKETAGTPLSDQEISQIMETRGLKVARRTVAKYRDSLGIKSSSQRKKVISSTS